MPRRELLSSGSLIGRLGPGLAFGNERVTRQVGLVGRPPEHRKARNDRERTAVVVGQVDGASALLVTGSKARVLPPHLAATPRSRFPSTQNLVVRERRSSATSKHRLATARRSSSARGVSDHLSPSVADGPKKTNIVEAIRFLLAVVLLGARKCLKRRDVVLVSPVGIEPTTNRLRVFARAIARRRRS